MRLATGFLLAVLAAPSLADTLYVSDQLNALLRAGPSRDQTVIAAVPSGSEVTVLEKNDAAGFSRIQAKNGQQGWIMNDQLSPNPAARVQLTQMQTVIEQLKAEHAKELEDLRQGMGQAMKQENEQLRVRATELEKRVEVLDQQNRMLQDRSRQEFFLYGGGVAFIGLLFGLIIPRLKMGRQRDRWY